VAVAGGPSTLALSPDRPGLYVGCRTVPAIASFRIDPGSGRLTPSGTVALEAAPTFLATDRTGRFLLSAYYQGGHVAVHPLGADGAVGAPPCDRLATEAVPSAFGLDPAGQFAAAAGTVTGRLAVYRIQGETGALTPLATYAVGRRPMGVLITQLGN
jgi:6-phosphogluconolactonase